MMTPKVSEKGPHDPELMPLHDPLPLTETVTPYTLPSFALELTSIDSSVGFPGFGLNFLALTTFLSADLPFHFHVPGAYGPLVQVELVDDMTHHSSVVLVPGGSSKHPT